MPTPIVYIVDDDLDVRESLAAAVATAGHVVRHFGTGQELLDDFDPDRPACVISDVRLPRMSGIELHRELVRRHGDAAVILVTGFADVPTAVRSIRGGALDYIEKPVRPELLLDRVRQALARDTERRDADAERRRIRVRLDLLSPRERQVVDLVVAGLTSKQIAARLELSPRTIHAHRAEARAKMQAPTTADLIRLVLTAEGSRPRVTSNNNSSHGHGGNTTKPAAPARRTDTTPGPPAIG